MRTDKAALAGFATGVRPVSKGPAPRPPTFSILAEALFRRRDRRSSTIDEGEEHSNTAVAFLQNVRTGIAERLVRKSTPPTAHPALVHPSNIPNHLVAVPRDALTNFRRCLIARRNADQAATRVYP